LLLALASTEDCLYRGCNRFDGLKQHRRRYFVDRQVKVRGRLNAEVRANDVGRSLSLQFPLLLVDLLAIAGCDLVAVCRPMQERMCDLMGQSRGLGRNVSCAGPDLDLVTLGCSSRTIEFAPFAELNCNAP